MDPVLITYASGNSSTAEVAEAVGRHLRVAGWPTQVVPITARLSPSGRRLVVVGAPIRHRRWSRTARRFLLRNRATLRTEVVGVFALGPRESTDDAFLRSRTQLGRSLAGLAWPTHLHATVFTDADPAGADRHHDACGGNAVAAWCDELLMALDLSNYEVV